LSLLCAGKKTETERIVPARWKDEQHAEGQPAEKQPAGEQLAGEQPAEEAEDVEMDDDYASVDEDAPMQAIDEEEEGEAPRYAKDTISDVMKAQSHSNVFPIGSHTNA